MTTAANQPEAIIWLPRDQLDQPAIALDAGGCLNKSTLLQALSRAFHFPDYFGENWDAAYDLLLDEVDQLTELARWRFSLEDVSVVDDADMADWLRLMADVCAYAESRGLELEVMIYGEERSPDGQRSQ